MSPDDQLSIERRIGNLEQTLAAHSALMQRNAEILDDIREHINKPARTPEWIAATIGVLCTCGMLLYMAYIKPIEEKLGVVDRETGRNYEYIKRVDEYAKDNRRMLNPPD